jgi:hypothetical protein
MQPQRSSTPRRHWQRSPPNGRWAVSSFWNNIPGNTEVKKVPDRKQAVARIWKAIQPLAGNAQPSEPEAKPKKPAKGAERAKKAAGPPRYNATSSPFLRPHRGLRSGLAARNILDIACFRNILASISKKAAPVAGRGGNWLLLRLRYLRCGTSARLPTRRFPDLGQRHSLGALHRRDHLRYGGPSGISNPMEWNGKAHGSTVEPAI